MSLAFWQIASVCGLQENLKHFTKSSCLVQRNIHPACLYCYVWWFFQSLPELIHPASHLYGKVMIFRVTQALISCVTLNELLHFSEHYAINNSFEIMCIKHPVQCLAYTWKLIFFCCDGETDDEDDDVGKPHFWYSPSLLWIMSQSTPFHFTFFSLIPVKTVQEVPAGTAWGQRGLGSVSLRHRRARPASCVTTQVVLWALDVFFFCCKQLYKQVQYFWSLV